MTQPDVAYLQLNRGNDTFTVRYWTKGEGEVVLFLHGLDGVIWTPFLDKLSNHFKVVVPEHPGFCETPRPDWLESMTDLTFHYLDLLDALNTKQLHIIGHSLGGWIAMELAVIAPERLRSLTLVDSLGIYDPNEPIRDIFFMPYEDVDDVLYYRQEVRDSLPPIDYITLNRNRTTTAQLGWNPRLHNPKLQTRLHRIKAPTLIVWGEQDGFVPPSYANQLNSLLVNSSVSFLKDCGHVPIVESPDELFEVVKNHLSVLNYSTK